MSSKNRPCSKGAVLFFVPDFVETLRVTGVGEGVAVRGAVIELDVDVVVNAASTTRAEQSTARRSGKSFIIVKHEVNHAAKQRP